MLRPTRTQSSPQLVALIAVVWLTASPTPAQQPAGRSGHPFDGEWSLVWNVATAPGGATIAIPGGTYSPYHAVYHAGKEQFQVHEDGTFEWAQSEAGAMNHKGTFNADGASYQFLGARKVHLRVAGKAQAPRTATGELRAEDRRLTLDLTAIGGNGHSSGTTPGSYATIVADLEDREMVMIPELGGTHRAPNPRWILKWQDLKPTRVTKEELAPDVIRETITYESTRETRMPEAVNGALTPPMTERIEVKHVRYLNLIPRG